VLEGRTDSVQVCQIKERSRSRDDTGSSPQVRRDAHVPASHEVTVARMKRVRWSDFAKGSVASTRIRSEVASGWR